MLKDKWWMSLLTVGVIVLQFLLCFIFLEPKEYKASTQASGSAAVEHVLTGQQLPEFERSARGFKEEFRVS